MIKDKPDKNAALIIICNKRSNILSTTKNVLALEVLEVLGYVISNLEAWSKYSKENSSEADFILAVYPIMNIILRSEGSLLKSQTNSGETTSSVTKDTREYLKKVFNIDSTSNTYGRKIDVMVVSNETKLPLRAIEWKNKMWIRQSYYFNKRKTLEATNAT